MIELPKPPAHPQCLSAADELERVAAGLRDGSILSVAVVCAEAGPDQNVATYATTHARRFALLGGLTNLAFRINVVLDGEGDE